MPKQTKEERAAYVRRYLASETGKSKRAAYDKARQTTDAFKERQTTYRASDAGRKSYYLLRFKACKPTQANWEHYRDVTHCECCQTEFGPTHSGTAKCQDHNHETLQLRGVICKSCNTAEGHIKTLERAQALVRYMERNQLP